MKTARLIIPLFVAVALSSCAIAQQDGVADIRRSFQSDILGRAVEYTVVLPAGYDRRAEEGKRFAVAYNLHCAGCTDQSILNEFYFGGGVQNHMDDNDFIIASIYDGMGDSWWVNSPHNPDWRFEDLVVREFKPLIDSLYATRADRMGAALIGHSMGGFGSLHIIARHSDLFGVCYAINPGTHIVNWSGWFGLNDVFGSYGERESVWVAHDINANANRYVDLPVRLCITAGRFDDWFYDENRMLHEALDSLGVEHAYYVDEAPHTPVDSARVAGMVRYLDSAFAGASLSQTLSARGPAASKVHPVLRLTPWRGRRGAQAHVDEVNILGRRLRPGRRTAQ